MAGRWAEKGNTGIHKSVTQTNATRLVVFGYGLPDPRCNPCGGQLLRIVLAGPLASILVVHLRQMLLRMGHVDSRAENGDPIVTAGKLRKQSLLGRSRLYTMVTGVLDAALSSQLLGERQHRS